MSGFKSDLRKALLARRRAIPRDERAAATRRIAATVNSLTQLKPGSRVALYISFGSELNPAQIVREARRRGIDLYVPVVIDLPRRRMRFVALSAAIRPGIERTRGNLGSLRFISARWFNLILLPIVGIDAGGHRLGMGAGFYDRALAFRRLRRHWKGPRLIALGFDCQRVEETQAQPWDARLDALITESGLHLYP